MTEKENPIIKVLEEVTFTLNEVRNSKLKNLKLNQEQAKVIEDVEKDLEEVITKIGLLLHPTEL